MERNRILELALQELDRQKAVIDADIEAIRTELRGTGTRAVIRQTPFLPSADSGRGRQRTPAERKAQAQRMREIWAARKAKAAKPAAPAIAAPAASSAKTRSMTAARKKALSLAMKKAWKRRNAAAAKNK
jgi:hypothetical protein